MRRSNVNLEQTQNPGEPASSGHRRTKPVRIGGLLRCCLTTLDEAENLKEEEGETLHCKYCSSSMIFLNDAWEWLRES